MAPSLPSSLQRTISVSVLACAFPWATASFAQDADTPTIPPEALATQGPPTLVEALGSGEAWLNLLARFEFVEDDAFSRDASGTSLRTALGYKTGVWNDFQGLLEFEAVTYLGDERFNNTTNGKAGRPVIADPEQAEINQAMVSWSGIENTTAWVGRRGIVLDNQRFVGTVAWRQNHQTYDSAGFEHDFGDKAHFFYAYLQNVNRIFGEDSAVGDGRMDSHLLNVSGDLGEAGRLVGYWYLLDNESPSSLDGFSTSTVGARFTGEHELDDLSLLYAAEFAQQEDVGPNPSDVDADYALAELGARRGGITVRVGYELLGGSGDPGDKFSTPLATLYKFNGWADKFLATPDTGLEDLYLQVQGAYREVDWQLAWHEFDADSGGGSYGSELDAGVGFDVTETVRCGIRVARYDADEFAEDTTKFWLWLSTSLL